MQSLFLFLCVCVLNLVQFAVKKKPLEHGIPKYSFNTLTIPTVLGVALLAAVILIILALWKR